MDRWESASARRYLRMGQARNLIVIDDGIITFLYELRPDDSDQIHNIL